MNASQEHILLVDDDPGITENLSNILEREGFCVTVATDGEEALGLLKATRFDLVLLDIVLGPSDGRFVVRRMHDRGDQTPVILITGQYLRAFDEVEGLKLGADDYIRKPFTSEVVVARIQRLLLRLRAGKPSLGSSSILTRGELSFDRRARRVYLQQRDLKLKPKQLALLECLMLHPDEVLSRNRILDDLGWDDPRLVDRHMAPLRKALGDDHKSPTFIETVHMEGYRFIGPVEGEV